MYTTRKATKVNAEYSGLADYYQVIYMDNEGVRVVCSQVDKLEDASEIARVLSGYPLSRKQSKFYVDQYSFMQLNLKEQTRYQVYRQDERGSTRIATGIEDRSLAQEIADALSDAEHVAKLKSVASCLHTNIKAARDELIKIHKANEERGVVTAAHQALWITASLLLGSIVNALEESLTFVKVQLPMIQPDLTKVDDAPNPEPHEGPGFDRGSS